MRIIGSADEFWRARLARVSAEDLDFEWHEDILYREPRTKEPDESDEWRIEAVRVDDRESPVTLAVFSDREDAEDFLARVNDDLAEMTKAQFESAYLPEDDRFV